MEKIDDALGFGGEVSCAEDAPGGCAGIGAKQFRHGHGTKAEAGLTEKMPSCQAHQVIVSRSGGVHLGLAIGEGGVAGEQGGTDDDQGGEIGVFLAGDGLGGCWISGEMLELAGMEVAQGSQFRSGWQA